MVLTSTFAQATCLLSFPVTAYTGNLLFLLMMLAVVLIVRSPSICSCITESLTIARLPLFTVTGAFTPHVNFSFRLYFSVTFLSHLMSFPSIPPIWTGEPGAVIEKEHFIFCPTVTPLWTDISKLDSVHLSTWKLNCVSSELRLSNAVSKSVTFFSVWRTTCNFALVSHWRSAQQTRSFLPIRCTAFESHRSS